MNFKPMGWPFWILTGIASQRDNVEVEKIVISVHKKAITIKKVHNFKK